MAALSLWALLSGWPTQRENGGRYSKRLQGPAAAFPPDRSPARRTPGKQGFNTSPIIYMMGGTQFIAKEKHQWIT